MIKRYHKKRIKRQAKGRYCAACNDEGPASRKHKDHVQINMKNKKQNPSNPMKKWTGHENANKYIKIHSFIFNWVAQTQIATHPLAWLQLNPTTPSVDEDTEPPERSATGVSMSTNPVVGSIQPN